ncbi:MAG: DnaD domain protein [Lactobacillus kalixensis]|uniref:DnaD domain protein n=1 Tax=Lactobacillus kalixensis TaxID=227944 RepID=UPI00399145EF
MFKTADPKQPYFVVNKLELFPQDEEVLTKLYQPIVGGMGTALYHTLIQNFNPNATMMDAKGIYFLQEQLEISLENLFDYLHKLEAVGLVKTYLISNEVMESIAFKLHKVPSSSEFYATPLLSSLLREKIGDVNYAEISRYFSKKNRYSQKPLKDAQDISASFLEVFSLPEDEAINPSEPVRQAQADNSVKPVETAKVNDDHSIDWDTIKQQFEMYQINPGEVDKNMSQIQSLMKTFGLSEMDFVNEVLPFLSGRNTLDMNMIANQIADNYKSITTRKQLQQEVQAHPEDAKLDLEGFDEKEKNLLRLAHTMYPAEFLYRMKSRKGSGGMVQPGEKRLISTLNGRYGLPTDMINVLIYVCLLDHAGVPSSYAYQVVDDWLQKGIKTGSQALRYTKKRFEEQQHKKTRYKVRNTQNKRVEQGTDWSKKKAEIDPNIDLDKLRESLKKYED